MTPEQLRQRLHECVSAGDLDELAPCRGMLHRVVNEWVDEAVELFVAGDDRPPLTFMVIGALFYRAVVNRSSPGVAEEAHDDL